MARRKPRRSLGLLFALLMLCFAGLAVWSGLERQWIVLAAALAIALWFAELVYQSLR